MPDIEGVTVGECPKDTKGCEGLRSRQSPARFRDPGKARFKAQGEGPKPGGSGEPIQVGKGDWTRAPQAREREQERRALLQLGLS